MVEAGKDLRRFQCADLPSEMPKSECLSLGRASISRVAGVASASECERRSVAGGATDFADTNGSLTLFCSSPRCEDTKKLCKGDERDEEEAWR